MMIESCLFFCVIAAQIKANKVKFLCILILKVYVKFRIFVLKLSDTLFYVLAKPFLAMTSSKESLQKCPQMNFTEQEELVTEVLDDIKFVTTNMYLR